MPSSPRPITSRPIALTAVSSDAAAPTSVQSNGSPRSGSPMPTRPDSASPDRFRRSARRHGCRRPPVRRRTWWSRVRSPPTRGSGRRRRATRSLPGRRARAPTPGVARAARRSRPRSTARTRTPPGTVTVLTIWYVRGSMTWSSPVEVSWVTMVVSACSTSNSAPGFETRTSPVTSPAVRFIWPIDAVGAADQPRASVVGLGADRGARVGVDRGDDHGCERGDRRGRRRPLPVVGGSLIQVAPHCPLDYG